MILVTFVTVTVCKMNKIDDEYKQRVELLDQDFKERMGGGEREEDVLRDYRKKFAQTKEKFERDYEKYLKKEMKIARKGKIMKRKNERFTHLLIKHFDFGFNLEERARMGSEILFFRAMRVIKTFFVKIIPEEIFYGYFRIKKSIHSGKESLVKISKRFYSAIDGAVSMALSEIWKYILVKFKKFMEILKKILVKLKKLIIFWKKEKEGVEKGEGNGKTSSGEETLQKKEGEKNVGAGGFGNDKTE